MRREDRQIAIMEMLVERRTADLDLLAERFDVSRMTIHRDLDELEQAGLLRKVRGGATIDPGNRFESDFRFRAMQDAEAKDRMARAALALVEPGMTVAVNDGSMAARLGALLVERRPLTVLTNNAAVITALAPQSGITLVALGGTYSAKFNGFFGLIAEEALARLSADIAFISAPAVAGVTAYHMDEQVVRSKRAMMRAARRACLLVNHRRFGQSALHVLAPLTAFDAVITDARPPAALTASMAEAGLAVTVAEDRR